MKIEIGEYATGAAKGFKYRYPKIECAADLNEFIFHIYNLKPDETYVKFLQAIARMVKQEYSEHVANTKVPIRKVSNEAPEIRKAMGEALASAFPDGILNTEDEVLNSPPWLKKEK